MRAKPKRVCVIGAGVSGMSSAIRCAEEGHQVTVVAKEEGSQTTSSVAAAFWYPFWTGLVPDHSWYKRVWAARTYRIFETLLGTPSTGISEVRLFEYFSEEMSDADVQDVIKKMWWRKHRCLPGIQFTYLQSAEFAQNRLRNLHFKAGISFRTFVITMSDYLAYLKNRSDQLGVHFEIATVTDVSALLQSSDMVVNCTGLGARTLVPDDIDKKTGVHSLSPVEGVVVRLPAVGGVNSITLIHTGNYFGFRPLYIVPRSGSVPDIILGGSITDEGELDKAGRRALAPQHLDFNSLPRDHWTRGDTNRIIADCYALEPKLTLENPKKLEVKVGYRPNRSKVRLEQQDRVIHNYGHGGGGVTFSWGCAEDVVRLVARS